MKIFNIFVCIKQYYSIVISKILVTQILKIKNTLKNFGNAKYQNVINYKKTKIFSLKTRNYMHF